MALNAKQPEVFYFKDDGGIPNNRLPLLLYRNALSNGVNARNLQKQFAANNWTNSWDNGVYSFHHYHSTSHEVLGIYSGSALLHLGGEKGEKLSVRREMLSLFLQAWDIKISARAMTSVLLAHIQMVAIGIC